MKRRWCGLFELFRELNWSLLSTLIVVSAIVAWAGDILGMKLGKKRISFMKLRPKYTSRAISVLTGIGIAIVTLLAASVTSESVRTALFSMRYVQSQITSLTAELQSNRTSLQDMEMELFQSRGELQEKQDELTAVENRLSEGQVNLAESRRRLAEMVAAREKEEQEQKILIADNDGLRAESRKLSADVNALNAEVSALSKDAQDLRANIQRLREGRIAALTGEILAQGVIAEGAITPGIIDDIVKSLSEESRARLAYRFGIAAERIAQPHIDKESVDIVKSALAGRTDRYLLRLTASANIVEGEPAQAELSYFESKVIFTAGTILAERRFQPGIPKEDLEDQLYRMLRDVNAHASGKGVLREPITGNVGTIDSSEFLDATDEIAASKIAVTLKILAAEDIYTEGPVKVKFVIQ